MAEINLNKLIADAKARDAEAKAKAESAQKSAGFDKSDAQTIAKYRRYMEYASTLRGSRRTFEDVINRYAKKIARGDKLDALEQNELDNAVDQYNRLDSAITKAQQDAYNVYTGREKSPPPLTEKVTGGKVTKQSTIEMPMGAGTVTSKGTKDTSTKTSTTKDKPVSSKAKITSATMPTFPTGGKESTGITADSGIGVTGLMSETTKEGLPATDAEGKPIIDTNVDTPGARTLESILGDVQNYFDLPDYIFKMDADLGKLLVRAVNEGWKSDRWGKEIELTNWWRKNSKDVRERLTSFGNYEDLRSQGQDVTKSDYGLFLTKKKNALKADARTIAGITLTDQQAEEIAKKIYLGFLDDDENAIRGFLVPFISKTPSIVGGKTITGYSGQALKDYQTLQSIAKANGLSLKDILPGISATTTGGDLEEAVLEKIALGELDVNRISQDARALAAIGQPEFVRGLLNQGYDLDQIYTPYKTRMATILEINPEQISLNDPTLRSGITDKGEMNLYDFEKQLRKDARWQYTQNARQEVSNSVLGVLRDFGFQG